MSEAEEKSAPAIVENIPSVAGGISALASANAPFIFFEGSPFCICSEGIVKITLASTRQIAPCYPDRALFDQAIVAHLVGSPKAFTFLRDTIDKILLAAAKTSEQGN